MGSEDMPDADDDNDLDTEISEDREETLIPPENLGSNISQAERLRAAAKRDGIAKAMWDQYQEERRIRGEYKETGIVAHSIVLGRNIKKRV